MPAEIPAPPGHLPAGDMYSEFGVKPTALAVRRFLQACKEDPAIGGALMWSMDQCETTPELWAEFLAFAWSVSGVEIGAPGPVLPEKPSLYAAVTTGNVWLREGPKSQDRNNAKVSK